MSKKFDREDKDKLEKGGNAEEKERRSTNERKISGKEQVEEVRSQFDATGRKLNQV